MPTSAESGTPSKRRRKKLLDDGNGPVSVPGMDASRRIGYIRERTLNDSTGHFSGTRKGLRIQQKQLRRQPGGKKLKQDDIVTEEGFVFEDVAPKRLVELIASLPQAQRSVLFVYTSVEYRQMGGTTWVASDNLSGFHVTAAGELVTAVGGAPGRGNAVLQAALQAGAISMACYALSQHLSCLLMRYGFREVERRPWKNKYAPPDWDNNAHDHPDIVVLQRG